MLFYNYFIIQILIDLSNPIFRIFDKNFYNFNILNKKLLQGI